MMTRTSLMSAALACGVFSLAANAADSGAPQARTLTIEAGAAQNLYGKDDIAQFKRLATGVGADFAQSEATQERLRRIGTPWLRMINVDFGLPGRYESDGKFVLDPSVGAQQSHWFRVVDGLALCKAVGANPHYVIGIYPPKELHVEGGGELADGKNTLGLNPRVAYWNGDWAKMRSYWKAIFEWVMVKEGFKTARFEVGNEPDTLGQFLATTDITMAVQQGSRKAYDAYFELYRNAYQAAREFEKEHPEVQLEIGGPALAWPYTFIAGELNWADQFIKDSAEKNVKPDFLGIHFYGNISGLREKRSAEDTNPPFVKMINQTVATRNKYLPGVPILLTEWGPSYHNHNAEEAFVNANNIGAAWVAEFIPLLAESTVDGGLYLGTTDYMDPAAKAPWNNVWGSISYGVSPTVFKDAWPKAPFHTLQMYTWLRGNRVKVEGLGEGVNGVAASSKKDGCIQLLVWNFKGYLNTSAPPHIEGANQELTVKIADAGAALGSATKARIRVWRVSETEANAFGLLQREGESKVDARSELSVVSELVVNVRDLAQKGATLSLPKASVALLSIDAEPAVAKK